MLQNAETRLYGAIGNFSTLAQVFFPGLGTNYVEDNWRSSFFGLLPSQCAAFLVSNCSFIHLIENWEISRSSGNPILQNKKIYPAKVTGLNIPYPKNQTFQWREGLIDNTFNQININTYQSYFRPGFGETILSDLSRPLLQCSVTSNNLGFTVAEQNSSIFAGPYGRLMSMAFYVDPEIAAKYDASTSKKKKKSLNSQDYEQMPTYPGYTPYVDNSGY